MGAKESCHEVVENGYAPKTMLKWIRNDVENGYALESTGFDVLEADTLPQESRAHSSYCTT